MMDGGLLPDATADVTGRLGAYLRDRRAQLDPATLGFAATRRRTPGLRREEVAQRAHISATWYTWLEQGRGGAPSAAVLDRIADALMLTEGEREHLFLLGLGHPPGSRYRGTAPVTPRLQRVLDALDPSPALIRNALWDVVAWNRAATVMLTNYAALPPTERNILRLIFLDPRARDMQPHWHEVARFVVGAFRADATRTGATAEIGPLVQELSARSPEFRALWQDNAIPTVGEAVKRIDHPLLGPMRFECSAFAVEGRPDLGMVVYNPLDPDVATRLSALLAAQGGTAINDPPGSGCAPRHDPG